MAAYQLTIPDKFSFKPEEWQKWIRRFERFSLASGLNTKPQEEQVNALVYAMGDKADDILRSLTLSDAQKKNYNSVKEKLFGYRSR